MGSVQRRTIPFQISRNCARVRLASALSPNGYTRAFSALSRMLGLGITLHSLRHTQVTVLLAAGVLDLAAAYGSAIRRCAPSKKSMPT